MLRNIKKGRNGIILIPNQIFNIDFVYRKNKYNNSAVKA